MYKKIDIYVSNILGVYNYKCSTNASKTCKEAKQKYLTLYSHLPEHAVKAKFCKVNEYYK